MHTSHNFRFTFFIIFMSLLFLFNGCSQNSNTTKNVPTPTEPVIQKETNDITCDDSIFQTSCPKKGDKIAVFVTDFGTIKIKLFPLNVSETVKNFETLANQGFYNNLTFHRVIKDFMIQGGDPKGDGTGGYSYKGPGTTIAEEFDPQLSHVYGALSMAKTNEPNTTGSQFFIVQNKEGTHWLDGKHSVFGQVFEGLKVVEAIAAMPVSPQDRPLRTITMKTVMVVDYSGE
ncbi:peptidylprolyl isomerase [Candidatus Peregrinibacteria bacterium]|nr:peptidylprolyl isomerase [Candidatus Peregrinibacteria bacterium]